MPSADNQVSVIIPAYGVSAWIGEAVSSALGQSHPPLEVIVINDGSPDTSQMERALEPFRSRIVYLTQSNLGASAARNAGLSVARGEWCAFLDGDDAWEPTFLESQLDWATENRLDLVWSNGVIVGEVKEVGRPLVTQPSKQEHVTVTSLLLQEHSIVTSSTVVRRDHLVGVQGFDERLRRAQDFDMWVRLVSTGTRAGFNPARLVRYRIRGGNLSGGALDQVARASDVMRHIAAHVPLSSSETAVLQGRLADLDAHRSYLEGRRHLSERQFDDARHRFSAAAGYFGLPRLRLLAWLVGVAPDFARWLYFRVSDENTL